MSSPHWNWRKFLAILFRGCIQSFLIKESIFHYKVIYHTKRILTAFMNSLSMYMQSLLIKLPRFTLENANHLTCRAVVQNYNLLACSPTFSLLSTQKTTLVPVPRSHTTLASTRAHSNARHARRLMDVSSAGHRTALQGRDGVTRAEQVRCSHPSLLWHKLTGGLLRSLVWRLYKSQWWLLRNFPVKHVSGRKYQFITTKTF